MFHKTLGLLLGLAVLTACAPGPPPVEDQEPWNVVFLLVDTLRADHLGAYGYERGTSPNFDALAQESVLFERAIAQAGCTFPSVNSLLTSRYPALFITAEERFNGIPDDLPSLPKILQQHGYATAAVSASPIVTNNPSQYNPDGGFGGGFDIFYEGCQWAAAECLHRRSAALLNRLEEPFFLYLHYMEPHGPYKPPASHPLQFVRPYAGTEGAKEFIADGNPNPIAKMMYSDGPKVEVTDRDLEHLVDLYDEEIFYFDGQLARLLEQLRQSGRLERTLLILASDHGEEFLEHEHIKHCRSVYQELIHVPLLLRLPDGVPAGGRRIPGPVENLDVVPTILDYLGIDASPYGFEGQTLRPRIEGRSEEAPEASRAYAFQRYSRALLEGDFKLILDFEDPDRRRQALYDLAEDPGEQRAVEEQHREVFRRLRRELLLWVEAQEGNAERGVRAAREAEKQLKALGYLQ
jgi:arylsulfatase A-like enzyme